ncbi:TRADD-N-associated membrane domain-containing protein [Polaromonas hydrogenivorans]|uniref:Cyanobacterial TRADD-N associated 2 transmembrane domain-containing protein n=1 Tax=Polaromonas hydrogenivorans TaxID=335476 RepID=A0AAU7LRD8_9BURK
MDFAKNQLYIDAYYKTNQAHVKLSFWASLIALVVGLVVLVTGIGLALAGSNNAVSTTTTAAGVITQFISAGFFFIYSKNLKQLNVFYE